MGFFTRHFPNFGFGLCHQPANFLTDGKTVTGFLDFEDACFRDHLLSIAKYPVYDLHPFDKAGFVDLYLDSMGLDRSDFAPRLNSSDR